MKLRKYIHISTAAAVAASLSLSACNKKGDDTDSGGGSDKPAPADTGSAGGGDTPAAKSVADQIEGYWAPNKEDMMAMMKEEAEKSGETIDAAALAFATQMIEMMADQMVLHLADGKSTMHSPDGSEEGSYKVLSSDDATGAFELEMTEPDGPTQTGKGTVKGDTMTMSVDGQTMAMDRLSDAEFAERMKKIKEAGAVPTPPNP